MMPESDSVPEKVVPLRGFIDEVRVTQGEARYGRTRRSRFLFLDKPDAGHTHVDENGFIVRCYHKTRSTLFSPAFWFGVTMSFPIEHWLWHSVWPFNVIAKMMGLD